MLRLYGNFFCFTGIPLENLRRLVRFVLFWYTYWKNILLLFTITELRRIRLWYIKHLVSVQRHFFEIDDAGKVHNVKFQGGCSGNTQGSCQTCRRHGCQRSDQQNGRDSLWLQTNILPGSACKSSERSSELILKFRVETQCKRLSLL